MPLRPLVVFMLSAAATACYGPTAGPSCAGAITDVCRKMRDIDAALGIQVADGVAAAGAGQLPPTAQGWGNASIAVRASFAPLTIPRLDNVPVRSDSTAAASVFPGNDGMATSLTAEIALGIWRGARVKTTRIGGIDLFGNLIFLRDVTAGGVLLSSNGKPGFGLGARVTLFGEIDDVPGISLTLAHRRSPSMTLTGMAPGVVSGESTQFTMDGFRAQVTGGHLAAAKRFRRIRLRGGIGLDRYEISSTNSARLLGSPGYFGTEPSEVTLWRATALLGASLDLRYATLVGEVGQHFGGDAGTRLNSFASGSPTASRSYFTLGLRIGD